MAKVFQVQPKDSVLKLNAFDAINAIQNFNTDPAFNEEYYSEFGNVNFTTRSIQPEVTGSFESTATGSIPAMLARMRYDYDTQTYTFDPSTKGNVFTLDETDFEFMVFDVVNLKRPGATFDVAQLLPHVFLTGVTMRMDSTGTGGETYNFEGQLEEAFYKPYHDMVAVPVTTTDADTVTIPAAYTGTINSGTHAIMYVFQDGDKFDSTVATWASNTTIDVTAAAFTTSAPYDRMSAVLYARTPGAFPTIYYPTTARFVRGDRADIWLVFSGTTTLTDANRLLRCQSIDITVDLPRERLTEIKRNDDKSTVYFRGLNYPLTITGNLTVLETTLETWAALHNKTLNEAAAEEPVDTDNVLNLPDFVPLTLVMKYYTQGSDTAICTVTMDNCNVVGWSNRMAIGGRGEYTINVTGSEIEIVGIDG
jgi:hypothetical protein